MKMTAKQKQMKARENYLAIKADPVRLAKMQAIQKAWREKNKEKLKAQQKARRQSPENVQYMADYYQENKERIDAKNKVWYQDNIEHNKARQKTYNLKNADHIKSRKKEYLAKRKADPELQAADLKKNNERNRTRYQNDPEHRARHAAYQKAYKLKRIAEGTWKKS